MRPLTEDHPPYFSRYIDQVKQNELKEAFSIQSPVLRDFLSSIPAEKWDYKYADDKWTIKELIQHCIDGERVFAYRAMCIARKETVSLPSFDENTYAGNSEANLREPQDLIEEFLVLREASELMFNSFTDNMLSQQGIANNNKISVLSLGYILVGHVYHHMKVVRERYL